MVERRHTAEFIISAVAPEQFPRQALPEIAFLGRSNVGKSSLLNCLVGGRGVVAFVASRPGSTQAINFYQVGDRFCFADLPGYGYARVPKEKQAGWKRLAETYLLRRESLQLCFLLLDARRGWMEKDLELKRWLQLHGRRFQVVATKMDKLTQSEQYHGLASLRGECAAPEPLPFSAVTGQGAREIWQAIYKTTKNP